ncbi:integral membrane protein [Aspergillus ambiguus]|uniref:putative integral membrane protein n=1 Tax=Aspergillus ambiguus TaxID=176160 RepID=UPI003CCE4A9D
MQSAMGDIPLLGREASGPSEKPIYDTVQKWNIATQSLCIIVTTIFFILRAYTRIFLLNGFSKEDWFCLGAWFLGVCYSVIALIMGHFGGGLHIKDVPEQNLIPFEKTVYVTMVMYGPTAFLTKLSLLWIMTRVFSPFRKCVIFIYVFLALMLAYYIPAVIVKIRICDPIAKFWATDTPGSCLNQSAIIMADAVVSVVSDMIVLVLPLPLTLGLQLPTKKKMRVMAILGAGGLACASSVVRLVLIKLTGQSSDGTMSFMRINMFGNAEIAIGIICACLPALSALMSRAYTQYSSNRYTREADYELSKYRHQSRSNRSEKTSKSRGQLSFFDPGSDQDVLVQNVQSEPKIEATVQQSAANRPQTTGFGIVKTVDLSTSISPAGQHD